MYLSHFRIQLDECFSWSVWVTIHQEKIICFSKGSPRISCCWQLKEAFVFSMFALENGLRLSRKVSFSLLQLHYVMMSPQMKFWLATKMEPFPCGLNIDFIHVRHYSGIEPSQDKLCCCSFVFPFRECSWAGDWWGWCLDGQQRGRPAASCSRGGPLTLAGKELFFGTLDDTDTGARGARGSRCQHSRPFKPHSTARCFLVWKTRSGYLFGGTQGKIGCPGIQWWRYDEFFHFHI